MVLAYLIIKKVWKVGNYKERNMKRIYLLAALLGIAISCQVEDITPEVGGSKKGTMEFEAHSANTRSVLNDKTPEWSAGETIYVFNSSEKEVFTGQNAAQTATTKFKGAALDGKAFIAVSPTTAVGTTAKADLSNKTISQISIPTEQTATANTYDPKAFVAVAYTEDDILRFDSAVSLLKFTMGESNVTEVTFAGWNGENITGTGTVSFNSDAKPVVTVNTTYVKLKGSFTKGKTYYVAVAPNTFSKGLICEFGSEKVRVTESSIELKPNQITDLGEITYSTVRLRGGFNSWGETRMAKCGEWYAAYNVQLNNIPSNQDAGFKFTTNNNSSWYGCNSSISTYKDYTATTSGGNIKLTGDTGNSTFKNAYFDVFFNPNTKKFKVRVANEREKRAVTITVKNTVNWSTLKAYGWYVSNGNKEVWGGWPGKDIKSTLKVEIPADQFGSEFYYIFNNGSGKQTNDEKVFVTGDFEYDLTDSAIK